MSLIRFPLGRWLAALVCLFAAAAAQATIPDTYVVWPGVRVLIDDLRHRQAVIVEADLASLVESQMKPQLIEAIAQANADSEALDVKLIDVGFREWKEGSSRITLYVRVDTTGRWNVGSATLLQGSLECEVYARVEIARAPWKQIKPVDAGSSAECSSGQLPGLFVQSIEGKIETR